jgi:hypothetical protein
MDIKRIEENKRNNLLTDDMITEKMENSGSVMFAAIIICLIISVNICSYFLEELVFLAAIVLWIQLSIAAYFLIEKPRMKKVQTFINKSQNETVLFRSTIHQITSTITKPHQRPRILVKYDVWFDDNDLSKIKMVINDRDQEMYSNMLDFERQMSHNVEKDESKITALDTIKTATYSGDVNIIVLKYPKYSGGYGYIIFNPDFFENQSSLILQ